ncbi:DALR anticodon-binding domain-containing protein [Nonomuraea basaltis]|uniref:DALR anticodon-binding domain-containing protein n=1 Tax=Nonomuraea basaltis TaxID=2495887 RepID=UPI00110C56D3|nr:DALR anticodon-binding domain-containing protein [Nonomuraea basaltis]TMR95805.1 anticodon-binding protein [Nonomuraea basaltis]
MTLGELAEVLGEPPVPEGTWEREALYVSAAALRRRVPADELAALVRALPGVAGVEVRENGFLRIAVSVPGEIVATAEPVDIPEPGWSDSPRTWENPGFVVRYAHARACAVRRWAGELGVPVAGFRPELLSDPYDRRVLRVLAELPGRLVSRDPGWETYLVRLALAYHDAHEHAPAVPRGDEPARPVHTARVRLAEAVRGVLMGPDRL